MNWVKLIEQEPETGLEVKVKTIYGFEDYGIWDGKQWLNKDGGWKGDKEEVTEWTLTTN
mgnify:CR=1 FL=1